MYYYRAYAQGGKRKGRTKSEQKDYIRIKKGS
jgi:hypothetical protein